MLMHISRCFECSVMTPYYREAVTYSKADLYTENEDGVSTIFYLQNIYPDEWRNFLERLCVIES